MPSQWGQPAPTYPGQGYGSPQMGGGWSSVLTGYQSAATPSFVTKGFLNRNLDVYKKFGLETNLKKIEGMTSAQRERQAVKAVLKEHKITVKSQNRKRSRGMA